MDFKQLQSFISVVRCKSFTEAAEELGISQPTISTHIRILEEELNSRLIVRTAKSFEVTPRGTELFECAQNILKLRDDMINRSILLSPRATAAALSMRFIKAVMNWVLWE